MCIIFATFSALHINEDPSEVTVFTGCDGLSRFTIFAVSCLMCIDELCLLFIHHNKKDSVLMYNSCYPFDIPSLGII